MIATRNIARERERLVFHALRRRNHALAGGGGLVEAARKPLEERQTQPGFNPMQSAKSGRVVDREQLGGTSQGFGPRHGQDKPQLIPIVEFNLHFCKCHLHFSKLFCAKAVSTLSRKRSTDFGEKL